MWSKITWDMVYRDFTRHNANLAKLVNYYYPIDHLMLLIYLIDGTKLTYSYLTKKTVYIKAAQYLNLG